MKIAEERGASDSRDISVIIIISAQEQALLTIIKQKVFFLPQEGNMGQGQEDAG